MQRRVCFWALLAIVLAGCKDDEGSGPSQGDEGEPQRIISLTPSTTEIVAAAGGAEKLVGVDRYSEHPPEVEDLPNVGDFINPSFEAILRLEPDLVILDKVQRKVTAGLEAAGVETLVLQMHTLADVREGLRRVGKRLGTSQPAERSIERLEAAVQEVEDRAAERDESPSVLLIVDRQVGGLGDLVAAAPGSFLDELLAIVGAENAFAGAGSRYANISPESVVRAAPDIIIETTHADDPEGARDDWNELRDVPAIERDRVHIVSASYYTSPSPRADRALRGLEKLVFGD